MAVWLIGVDDTDVVGSPGTGRQARALAARLREQGFSGICVTRHQLLVHPDIPYTSHNSAACIAFSGQVADADGLFDKACRFVLERCPDGSDPGVCLAPVAGVTADVMGFGRRAQREVVNRREAETLSERTGLRCAGLAGTKDGLIGALAAVGLRACGSDGRFIEIGRCRVLTGTVTVGEILSAGVAAVRTEDGFGPAEDDVVETLDWVRPRLLDGRPVLIVERSSDNERIWTVAGRPAGHSR